ncbi:MAG: DUF2806 domain-containing protein [Parasphingopyxis sp.]|uniref:DUF2806 domain-containing protein n=1 Tax=Parasphingopyxis sp. TaxID=1920299 RepID=UPI003FA03C1C
MENDQDPLSGELSVEVKLDEKGVKAAAKSRAIVAIDRLLGGMIDIPGGYIEGISRRQRVRNQVREQLLLAEGQAALDKIGEKPNFGQRIIENFADELADKRINRENIAYEAIEDLREKSQDDISESGSIDDDWMNMFSSHAEKASSDHIQKLWGRVLAGEIRKPGSYSLSTLRFISELDKEIASTFDEIAKERISDDFLIKPDEMVGQKLIDLIFMEEIGLLQNVAGLGGIELEINFDSKGIHYERRENLLLISRGKANKKFKMPVIKITRIGREICSILPKSSPMVVLESIGDFMTKHAEYVEIAIILEEDKRTGAVRHSTHKILKREEES